MRSSLSNLPVLISVLALPCGAQNAFRPLPAVPELAAGGAGAAPSAARRRFDELELAAEGRPDRTFVEARATAGLAAGADLDGGGSLSTQHGGWTATFGRELGGERLAALSLSTQAFFYNFGGDTALVPADDEPFNDLYEAELAGMVRSAGPGAGWFAGAELALGGEDEASPGESATVGGVAGVHYAPRDDLQLEMGLAAQSRLEDDVWVWPFVGVRWNAGERWSFEAQGTRVEAQFVLGERWSALARAEYTLRQFRLNRDNPLPRGVLRDEQIRVGLGVERRGDDGLGFELVGGLEAWRELSTLDRDGEDVAEIEADPAPFVAFSLTLAL
jgi:hypothetical protein